MNPNTIKIETPVTKTSIELREWITGKQAEYIQQPIFQAVDVRTNEDGSPKVGAIALERVVESNHRKIESFVVSFNDEKENLMDKILALPENDFNFIVDKIEELRKKK